MVTLNISVNAAQIDISSRPQFFMVQLPLEVFQQLQVDDVRQALDIASTVNLLRVNFFFEPLAHLGEHLDPQMATLVLGLEGRILLPPLLQVVEEGLLKLLHRAFEISYSGCY